MAFSAPNLVYVSGAGYDTATSCSQPIFSAPFPGVNRDYLMTQDYICALNSYSPMDLNTAHPDYSDFILVSEGERRDLAGGIQRWTRTYAKFPDPYSQPNGTIYNFIGYLTTDTPAIIGRNRFQAAAAARVQYDYFLLDPITGNIFSDAGGTVVYTGTPGVLPSVSHVPIIQAQKYFDSGIGSVKLGIESDSISYGVDAGASEQTVFPVPDLTPNQPPYFAYPTREVYESWRDQTQTVFRYDPVANTSTDTGTYDIVAIGSQCSRWQGNYIERQTLFIRPT